MRPLYVLLASLSLSSAALALPLLDVHLNKGSEKVEVRLRLEAPFQGVTQRWKENPHRLEVVIPNVDWKEKSVVAIDRGIVQRLEAKPSGSGAILELITNQNPKMSWNSSPDRKEWTLVIRPSEMASGSDLPRLPGATAASTGSPGPAPVAAPRRPAPGPSTAVRPVAPARPGESTRPARPPSPGRPTPPPAAARPDQKPITLSFDNKPLGQAIREMAAAAGLEADVAAGVEGKVTANFQDIPLGRALTSVLGKQEKLYEYKIVNNRLQVFADANDVGVTKVVPPPTPPTVPSGAPTVSDYFPIINDKSAAEVAKMVRKVAQDADVLVDDRLNVLFVRARAEDLEKVRNLLRGLLAK